MYFVKVAIWLFVFSSSPVLWENSSLMYRQSNASGMKEGGPWESWGPWSPHWSLLQTLIRLSGDDPGGIHPLEVPASELIGACSSSLNAWRRRPIIQHRSPGNLQRSVLWDIYANNVTFTPEKRSFNRNYVIGNFYPKLRCPESWWASGHHILASHLE